MVLCHAVGRTVIDEYEDYHVPDLRECIAVNEPPGSLMRKHVSWTSASTHRGV